MQQKERVFMKRAVSVQGKVQNKSVVAAPVLIERLPPFFAAALTSLVVLAPLLPFDTAAGQWNNVLPLMLWIILITGWFLAGVLRGRLEMRLDATTCAVLVLTLLPLVSAAWLTLNTSGNARYALNLGWQWAGFGMLFFYARQTLRSVADARLMASVMIALTVGLSTFALLQYAYLMPQSRAEYRHCLRLRPA
jgi:hypothetical protein